MALRQVLSEFVPFKKALVSDLRYAGYEEIPIHIIASRIFVGAYAIGFLTFLATFFLLEAGLVVSVVAWLAATVAVEGVAHMVIIFKGDKRAAEVDKILPDALQLISSNIRSGMTIDRAIWLSARPEFGPLETEIKRVSTEILGSATIPDALSSMIMRIRSKSLDRAIRLINEGLHGGGEMAKLLDQVSLDIRNFQTMAEEVKATTTTYAIFIMMAAVVGAPLLFAISTYFIEIVHTIFATRVVSDVAVVSTGPLQLTGPSIEPGTVKTFALAALITISLFASLTVGLIRTGEERNGLKYVPLLVPAALAVFFITRFVVSSLFGSILVL